MEAAFVVDGALPDPENTTNPYLMRFAVDHGCVLPCKCIVEETTTGVLKPKGLVLVSVATVSDGDGSLSRGMPTPSSEHNHEERVLHPPCRRLRLYFSCVVWTLALSCKRSAGCRRRNVVTLETSWRRHTWQIFYESRGQEQQAKTAMSTRCSGRGGGVEDTTPNVCHTPFLTPLIICSICCWHCPF